MITRIGLTLLISGLMLGLPGQIPGEEPVRDLTWFLRRLRSVDHLPELEASHTAMSSTWDRTGGNADGTDFKNLLPATPEAPARNVLLDEPGPGCIHRIFVGRLAKQQAGTRIQVFLDHDDRPIFDMPILEFFDDAAGPFPYPLVFHKSYPGLLFPIPFEKHCRVQLVNEGYGKAGWDDAGWSNYWQITYTRYPPTTPVTSLRWPLEAMEKDEVASTVHAWLEAESSPPAEPAEWTVDRSSDLDPGAAVQIDLAGTGVIRQMRIRVEPATPEVLGGLRMQMTWDGAGQPSVDVPVGYFFGHAHCGHAKRLTSGAAVLGRKPLDGRPAVEYTSQFNSLLLGTTETEGYCCFPMPFAQGAIQTFQNASGVRIENLRVRLEVETVDRIPADWGRFHTTWRQARAATEETPRFGPKRVPGNVVLDRACRGKYVGVMLSVDWPHPHWWGEGDWLIWTDQDGWPPDYHGTGSEEYFNSGWCQFDRKAVSGFVALRPGHPTVYSFHLNDAFQFQRRIRVVEEQMGLGKGGQLIHKTHPLWSSTAYWYALPATPAGSHGEDVRAP